MLLANGGYRFPWCWRACAAAVDRALGAAIKKRPEDAGSQSVFNVLLCSPERTEKLGSFKAWKGGRVV